jgi:hypothetical protein
MVLYADATYPVNQNLETIHEKQIEQLSEPGTWGTGAQRLAIATSVRQASYKYGLQEESEDGESEVKVDLPAAALEVVEKLTVSPKDFLEGTYDDAKKQGLGDEEYVEIVGIVSRLTCMDVFARGLGVPLRPLPQAKQGQPSRQRPATAKKEMAWVPTIPNFPEGGEDAKALYGENLKTYIVRGLSLVPDEVRMHLELEEAQYLPMGKIFVPDYQHHEGFTRAQCEVVAGRVSAINECFF